MWSNPNAGTNGMKTGTKINNAARPSTNRPTIISSTTIKSNMVTGPSANAFSQPTSNGPKPYIVSSQPNTDADAKMNIGIAVISTASAIIGPNSLQPISR